MRFVQLAVYRMKNKVSVKPHIDTIWITAWLSNHTRQQKARNPMTKHSCANVLKIFLK